MRRDETASLLLLQLMVIVLKTSFGAEILNAEDQKLVVDLHNELRRREGAANMKLMGWNDTLAEEASEWTDNCIYEHGPLVPSKTSGGKVIANGRGQNIYITHPDLDLTRGLTFMWLERTEYDFPTYTCHPVKYSYCGHYTQMVWSDSDKVGCAKKWCDTIKEATLVTTGYMLVCNYMPGGNVKNKQGIKIPYIKAEKCSVYGPCSKCSGGIGWCNRGLCDETCSRSKPDCECKIVCENCGKVDEETCKCSCAAGWFGDFCEKRCENINKSCGVQFPKSQCGPSKTMKKWCPATCDLCTLDPSPKTCQPSVSASWSNPCHSTKDGDDPASDGGSDGSNDSGDGDKKGKSAASHTNFTDCLTVVNVVVLILITVRASP